MVVTHIWVAGWECGLCTRHQLQAGDLAAIAADRTCPQDIQMAYCVAMDAVPLVTQHSLCSCLRARWIEALPNSPHADAGLQSLHIPSMQQLSAPPWLANASQCPAVLAAVPAVQLHREHPHRLQLQRQHLPVPVL
jgi:hypothetical protein